MTITIINSVRLEFQIETLVMLVGPRFALSEFSLFTYTKLENSDLEKLRLFKNLLKQSPEI